MADLTNVKFINFELLTAYDVDLKKYIGEQADKTSLHTVAKDSSVRKIYFYKEAPADVVVGTTTPAFTIDMSDIDTTIGVMANLETTEKANLVGAINELYNAIDGLGEDKADKVENAVEDNFVGLDAEGNIKDSGFNAGSFDVAGAAAAVSGYGEGETAKTVKQVATEVGDVATITVETASGVKAANVVAAVNQLEVEIGELADEAKVTMAAATTPTEGYLKTYVFTQGENEIGKVDIPKDYLVSKFDDVKVVEVDDQPKEGFKKGDKYITLYIVTKDAPEGTGTPLYIKVSDFAKALTVEQNAAQIQLALSDDNVISGVIVDGSVDADALGTDAVTTGKIADLNVTKGKLEQTVQDSLDLADTALQAEDIVFATEQDIHNLFKATV